MKKNIIILIFILFGINLGLAQNATIEGKLVPTDSSDYKIAENIETVFMMISKDKNRSAKINSDLSFRFENVESDSIILIIPATIKKTSYRFYIENNKTKKIEIPISYYCEYDNSENNKTCPICHKYNRVIPVSHGLSIHYDKEYHDLGCLKTECDPNWFCKRDNITF
tara:strand:- start:2128 stop:2631 length:504 start_codon:yes stop_codon:yes gene_type:complete